MDILNDPIFQAIFNTSIPRIILKADAPAFTVVTYNDAYKMATHTNARDIRGQSFWKAYNTENAGGNGGAILMDALMEALGSNQVVHLPPFRFDIPADDINKLQTNWWQLEIVPVRTTPDPQPNLLIININNLTEQTLSKQIIDEGLQREQLLNEEMSAFNEELTTSNEELVQSQAALLKLNNELEQRVQRRTKALAESEVRFRNLIQQAPIGIAIYSGPELEIEVANNKVLEIWGRGAEVIGKPLLKGRPELEGHPYVEVITNVYNTGQPHYAYEVKGGVLRNNQVVKGYFDVVYQPLLDNDNEVTGLIVVINEVTEKVQAQKQIEKAEEMLRLAVDLAQLGTWYLNVDTREFTPSQRLKELFGFHPDEEMSYEAAVNQIAEEYRDIVVTAVELAISKGQKYDLEYPIIGYHDQKMRWVRAIGRLYPAEAGIGSHFSGTMVDITELRQNEQRKNDFISMVSHELKTPLTSLKAYIQLLQAKAIADDDTFRMSMLGKADMQVNKMHKMINGFLSVAALESGKMQLVKEPFNLDETVQEMVDDAMISNPRFNFHFLPCEPLNVVADKDKIGQVITNLLSNAVKYSPDGGDISIGCRKVGKEALVMVKDNGIGIAKTNLPNLFERFYRVQSDTMKSFSGFGIGLYLCAEIIERHHGKIWAESEHNQGSAFYFTLPLDDKKS